MRLSKFFRQVSATAVLALALGMGVSSQPTVTVAETQVNAPAPAKQDIMLADEIIRRLRRLGLNFTKNRISHPYDPFGELC